MPLRTTPSQATDKWVSRLSGATEDIKRGIAAVQTAPGQAAARAHQKWIQNTMAAEAKWRRNVGAVSLEDWKHLATEVGVPRIAQGAQQKKGKYTAFANEFFPHLERGITQVANMPSTTLEDNINRATAMMRHNAKFKRGGAVAGS